MHSQTLLLLSAGRKSQTTDRTAARSLYGERASSGLSSAASGAMSTVGAVWSFVSAEAATEGSLAPEDAAPLPPPSKLDISVSVSVLSEGRPLAAKPHLTLRQSSQLLLVPRSLLARGQAILRQGFIRQLKMLPLCVGAAFMLYHDKDARSKAHAQQTHAVASSEDLSARWQAFFTGHTVMQVWLPDCCLMLVFCLAPRLKAPTMCLAIFAHCTQFSRHSAGRGSRPGQCSFTQEV